MKIVITGAGGGHFYPLIAVMESVRKEAFIQKIVQPELYFFSDNSYDDKALFSLSVQFYQIPAGKLRVYPSLQTLTDMFKTLYGVCVALYKLYIVYPDVIFAKGGYASFPTLFAARLLSIPVIVHESDSVPGRVTLWASKFAARVALSYQEVFSLYPQKTTVVTGQPIRSDLLPKPDYKREYRKTGRKTILVLGGSQGSINMNDAFIKILPDLLNSYDVIHQVGEANKELVKKVTSSTLSGHQFQDRYFFDGFINLSLVYPKVDLVITRAGSSMFEMALWQLPMIVIPIPETVSRDQKSNAYAMARREVAIVLEENNVSEVVFLSAIHRILDDEKEYYRMSQHADTFENSAQAANVIARELIRIGLSHLE